MSELEWGGGPCPCLRPKYGAVAVGILKLFTGPLSNLGLYWTVFVFLPGNVFQRNGLVTDYKVPSRGYHNQPQQPSLHNEYADVLKVIYYLFAIPTILPIISGIMVFVAVIKKNTKYLQWSLFVNLAFILSCVIVIILICSLGIKFLATLPLLGILMVHTYFLVVISLFKEWADITKYFEKEKSPKKSSSKPKREKSRDSVTDEPDAPPPPIPPRILPKQGTNRSNGDYYNISEFMQPARSTRSVTVTSV